MNRRRLALLLLFAATLAGAATPPATTHQDWRRIAAAARARQDYPAFLAATQAALALRPDSPRYLLDLAVGQVRTGRPDDALATLQRLTDLGIVLPLDRVPDLAPLRATPGFQAVLARLAEHARPRGAATAVLELPNQTGIIEGVAGRPATGEYFFGDVRHRCVWRRAPDGTLARFSAADAGLGGVFNVTVDETRRVLWLTTSAVPEIEGYTADLRGTGALCALDLATGAVVRRCPLPADGRDHCLGDLLLAPDGTVYVTDSVAPVIWRLAPHSDQLEIFLESPVFSSLQGLALVDHDRRLVVSDYSNGLWVIDLAHPTGITAIPPPPLTTLLGLDGLLADGNGILGVQNGIEPQRVVRLGFTPRFDAIASVEILAAALPGFDDLTLLTRIAGRAHVVSQSGWAGFDPPGHPAPHPVRLMRLGPP